MIQRITNLLLIILFCGGLEAQTYVNKTATGNNDGTSWVDAYTSLDSALSKTNSGEIWVAAGMYNHDGAGPDSFRTFYIQSEISLYGGFAGTESSLDERDPEINITTLSADFNGDDIEGRFDTLREDNSYHVITVDSFLTSPATIDGFTISGGNTGTNADLSQYNRRGAGIYSWSTINVSNCIIKDNFARGATGIFLDPGKSGGSGSTVTSNVFSGNAAENRGAGIYFFNQSDILIADNLFTQNLTSRGCVYPFRSDNITIRNNKFIDNAQIFDGVFCVGVFVFESTNVLIDSCEFTGNVASTATGIYYEAPDSVSGTDNLVITDCLFDNNVATNGFGGGAMYFWQAVGVRVENSTFSNHAGGNGGVFYHDGRAQFVDANNLVFRNCDFLNNVSTDFGGGVGYAYQSSLTFEDCYFDGNTAANGGSLFITSIGNGKEAILRNCEFRNGEANFGGACNLYSGESTFLVENCHFEGNEAFTSGGAIITGFQANTTIDSTTFMSNLANFGAGMYIQNDSTIVEITNSEFITNQAAENGGGLVQSSGSIVSVSGTTFNTNSAINGGGISTVEFSDDLVESQLTIDKSKFYYNSASGQGGGINIIGTDTDITNSVIANNFNLGGISGGGISGNASDSSQIVTINVLNSTIAANDGDVGSGIGLYTGANESSLLLTLQNTIMDNDGDNFAVEDGSPLVESKGGNFISDNSLDGVIDTELGDVVMSDADLFVDASDLDFNLVEGSPAINIGVSPAPATDIEGNERDEEPDAGAYEYQFDVSISDVITESSDQLRILPNPVENYLNLELDNDWRGILSVKVFNVNGQLVHNWTTTKVTDHHTISVNVENIDAGVYNVLVGNDTKGVIGRMIKQ